VETGGQLDIGWGTVVIGDAIGEGGMGIVYRGWLYYDPKGQHAGKAAHPVAIKVLHPLLRGREIARASSFCARQRRWRGFRTRTSSNSSL
jgi:hypothetical protein